MAGLELYRLDARSIATGVKKHDVPGSRTKAPECAYIMSVDGINHLLLPVHALQLYSYSSSGLGFESLEYIFRHCFLIRHSVEQGN